MKDVKKVFHNFEQSLRNSKWFDDGWEVYNRGPYLHLYKENWHNHNQGGVHFETYIEKPQIQKKEFPVHLHAEEDCPQQQRFIQELLTLEADRINSWKGYSVIGEGNNICSRFLPLNFKNLEQRLLEEFNRLRQLEASIDKVLGRVE
ncbi:hypothetical protein [Methylotuvimicrobium alcaliphilum]|uniref:DUF4268 domain-containing protein n=1 Tax=Methylotuvimicrobium alcaliphilum (strain DSM 19304 / NCIMB 14124 / VKM B-2133 / 20Z) TaxID=1091494 RepID=G4ST66_META2|nr:hypothetical protein [Methylotuvimicrobium alcaliphilum]CCE22776.1 conserved protein of unknown function [Methylotuvimicrobium alcaliphilum 20Z]